MGYMKAMARASSTEAFNDVPVTTSASSALPAVGERAETDAALREHTFRERVLADIEGGRRAGVHATPTFFLDGERLGRPWRELLQIVRASLTARP